MLDRELTGKTEEFLKLKFDDAEHFRENPSAKGYRIEHDTVLR